MANKGKLVKVLLRTVKDGSSGVRFFGKGCKLCLVNLAMILFGK
jgi:hypothetical protein